MKTHTFQLRLKKPSLFSPFLLSVILIGFSYTLKSQDHHDCGTHLPATTTLAKTSAAGAGCTASSTDYVNHYSKKENHIPNANTALKTVHVNVVIWQDDNGQKNFQNTPVTHQRFLTMMDWVNNLWFNGNPSPSDPMAGVTDLSFKKLALEFHEIYFMQNSAINASMSSANMNNLLFTAHPEAANFLNIHITSGHPSGWWGYMTTHGDRLPMIITTDDPQNQGYSCTSGACPISIAEDPVGSGNFYRDWSFAAHLAHELGHCFGLDHTYNSSTLNPTNPYFLSDVFIHNPTYAPGSAYAYHCSSASHAISGGNPFAVLNDGCTNNFMNGHEGNYMSPLQLGICHLATNIGKNPLNSRIGPFMSGYSTTPMTITHSESWDFEHWIYSDIVVETGATLEIKCTVYMQPEGKIIVKPGAKLLINGGTITKAGNCAYPAENDPYATYIGRYWQGVYLHGNDRVSQTVVNQPVLEMINGGTIEYARDGVTNSGVDSKGDWISGTTGGIIIAKNAHFYNNRRDVQLLSYHSYYKGVELAYQATFENTDFIRDDAYQMTSLTASVSIWDVVGVSFRGCRFDTDVDYYDLNQGTQAIYSLGGSFKVDGLYSKFADPHGGIYSEFSGYEHAIEAWNYLLSPYHRVTVQYSHFENNDGGIFLASINNAKIIENYFDIPRTYNLQFINYGLYFDASSAFDCYNNQFEGTVGSAPAIGALFTNCGAANNLAYRNRADNLSVGFEAYGWNRSATNFDGLDFRCNDLGYGAGNSMDIYVSGTSASGNQGISEHQGSYAGNVNNLANNLFTLGSSDYTNAARHHFYNYGAGDPRYNPNNSTGITEAYYSFTVNYNSACPDLTEGSVGGTGPGEDPSGSKGKMAQAQIDLNYYDALLAQYQSGADEEQLEALLAATELRDAALRTLINQYAAQPGDLGQSDLKNFLKSRSELYPKLYLLGLLKAEGNNAEWALLMNAEPAIDWSADEVQYWNEIRWIENAAAQYHISESSNRDQQFLAELKRNYADKLPVTQRMIDGWEKFLTGCTAYVESTFLPDGMGSNGGANDNKLLVENLVSLYPNPARESLQLEWNFEKAKWTENLQIQVFGLNGQLIQTLELDYTANRYELNCESWPAGHYKIRVSGPTQSTLSFVKVD
ncbi:T9SS type A sorting domain-containing protein [Croceimicrobium sp.]|uniref:T9SS type A sorting domain-containing protein n=1 Tax=Croceimicrobium sp. TaxID=2828340 RepID=UPI003BAC73E3